MSNTNYLGAAATTTGQVIGTTKVATTMQAPTQIRFTLTTASGEGATDVENLHIKSAAWRGAQSRKNVTFSGTNFASWDEFERFFNNFATQVTRIKVVTDDVDNFNGELVFTHKSPTGKETQVPFDLSKYKIESSKADGFSDTIEINDLPFVLGPQIDIMITELKKGSKVKFFMDIQGETKVQELTPIRAEFF